MANNEKQETRTKIDDINDTLTRAEQRVQNNKKIILWGSIGVFAIAAIILIFLYGFYRPAKEKGNTQYGINAQNAAQYEAMFESEQALSMPVDSAAKAEQLDAVIAGFEQTAANCSNDGANNARLNAAIFLYKKGEYQKAIDYLKDYDRSDNIIAATSKALEGDCYVNLDNLDEAIKCFNKAIDICDNNPELAPFFMVKKARVLTAQGNNAEAAEIYQTIQKEYPEYALTIDGSIEGQAARSAGKQAAK